jgi:hypothetical protein
LAGTQKTYARAAFHLFGSSRAGKPAAVLRIFVSPGEKFREPAKFRKAQNPVSWFLD